MEPLQLGRGIELAAQHSLAEVMPLREEPRAQVDARDLLGSGLVDERFQSGVRRQNGQGVGLERAGLGRHLVGNRQQHARLETYDHRTIIRERPDPWPDSGLWAPGFSGSIEATAAVGVAPIYGGLIRLPPGARTRPP